MKKLDIWIMVIFLQRILFFRKAVGVHVRFLDPGESYPSPV